MTMEFPNFGKVPRWSRDIVITEKLDGTNGLIHIEQTDLILTSDVFDAMGDDPFILNFKATPEGVQFLRAGSRERWLRPNHLVGDKKEHDNYGFAKWVHENASELFKLGPGAHYGEWWGQGIGRRKYNGRPRAFSLFNVDRWTEDAVRPTCCEVVPTLYAGSNTQSAIESALIVLRAQGSIAAPGFTNPEGIVIYHTASRQLYKKLLEKDELPKGLALA